MTGMRSFETRVLTSRSEIEDLVPQWEMLATECEAPLLSPTWLLPAMESFHATAPIRFIAVLENDRLLALAPLVRSSGGFRSRLTVPGTERLGEPGGLLACDSASAKTLSAALKKLPYPLILLRVPDHQPWHTQKHGGRIFPLTVFRQTSGTPFVDLTDGYEAYMASRSSRRRSDLRRAERRLAEFGEVGIDVLRPTPHEVPSILDRAIAVESKSWKGREGSAIATREDLSRFFSRFCEMGAGTGNLRIAFLKVGERDVATQIGIVANSRFWVMKIGYDEEFKKGSPGLLLCIRLIEWSSANDLSGYEFLGSEESWVTPWSTSVKAHNVFVSYPFSFWGIFTLSNDILRKAYGKLANSQQTKSHD